MMEVLELSLLLLLCLMVMVLSVLQPSVVLPVMARLLINLTPLGSDCCCIGETSWDNVHCQGEVALVVMDWNGGDRSIWRDLKMK
jgi:hypothetical protein